MLPEGDWKASESEAIATRLVNWLPERSAAAIPSAGGGRAAGPLPAASELIQSRAMTWLTWAVLAVAVVFLWLHLFGDHDLDVGRGTGVSTQQ